MHSTMLTIFRRSLTNKSKSNHHNDLTRAQFQHHSRRGPRQRSKIYPDAASFQTCWTVLIPSGYVSMKNDMTVEEHPENELKKSLSSRWSVPAVDTRKRDQPEPICTPRFLDTSFSYHLDLSAVGYPGDRPKNLPRTTCRCGIYTIPRM